MKGEGKGDEKGKGKGVQGSCYHCRKKGHTARNCPCPDWWEPRVDSLGEDEWTRTEHELKEEDKEEHMASLTVQDDDMPVMVDSADDDEDCKCRICGWIDDDDRDCETVERGKHGLQEF